MIVRVATERTMAEAGTPRSHDDAQARLADAMRCQGMSKGPGDAPASPWPDDDEVGVCMATRRSRRCRIMSKYIREHDGPGEIGRATRRGGRQRAGGHDAPTTEAGEQ